jgi:hypothetical protein
MPTFGGRDQSHGQCVRGFAVLHHFGSLLAVVQGEYRQCVVVDAVVQCHRHTLFGAGVVDHPFSLDRFLGLTEGEHIEVRFIVVMALELKLSSAQ